MSDVKLPLILEYHESFTRLMSRFAAELCTCRDVDERGRGAAGVEYHERSCNYRVIAQSDD